MADPQRLVRQFGPIRSFLRFDENTPADLTFDPTVSQIDTSMKSRPDGVASSCIGVGR